MISRPTTGQLLDDAARELLERVAPAVIDPGAKVATLMLIQIIRACGVRARHEIAWMRDEEAQMVAYADEVRDALPDAREVADAVDSYRSGRSVSLHLDDVAADYSLAGKAMSAAVDAAMQCARVDMSTRATDILAARVGREGDILGEFSLPGRG